MISTLINADLTGFFKQTRKISVEIVSGLDAFPAKAERNNVADLDFELLHLDRSHEFCDRIM